MSDAVVRFVGCVDMIIFFAADFFFAYVLHRLKQDHPAIDDCAPDSGLRDVDTIAVLSFMNNPTLSTAGDGSPYAGRTAATAAQNGSADLSASSSLFPGAAAAVDRENLIHKLVMAASFSAPIFSFLQVVSPSSLAWSQFAVPLWLGYLTMVPGLGIAMFYASRATRVSHFHEVSKAQWLSMMWFRLDIICVMATIFLLGWGDWLVAGCLYAVALYLAHRLMITEKRLVTVTSRTQLMREEISSGGGGSEAMTGGGGANSAASAASPSLKGYDSINSRR
jgi:hypothetical protein